MNRQILLLLLFTIFSLKASAQLEKTIHQTFQVENIKTVNLDLYGEYILEPWAGNNILVETRVELYNSTPSVLKHFSEKELRYQIDLDTISEGEIRLVSHDKKRISIRTKTGAESPEIITTKLFVPENFTIRDEKTLVIKAD